MQRNDTRVIEPFGFMGFFFLLCLEGRQVPQETTDLR